MVEEKTGKDLVVKQKKRRSQNEAGKLSARHVFVLQELLKVRRMTKEQIARLCRIDGPVSDASRSLRRRLESLEMVASENPFRDSTKFMVKLTDHGHRYACELFLDERMKTGWHYRDVISQESLLHLLKTTDLYVDIVARGASDWLEVREVASRFSWLAFNESIAFRWREPKMTVTRDVHDNPYLLPDAMMETEDQRFLIEIERPTKTLGVAFRKIDQYNRLFSIARSATDRSPYRQKYDDDLQPVVVFVFDCQPDDARRADGFRREMARRQANEASRFFIPAWEVKSIDVATDYLRKQAGIHARPEHRKEDELRVFVSRVLNSGISSLDWPENWRAVGEAIYSTDEWSMIQPRLEKRFADAANRKRGVAQIASA